MNIDHPIFVSIETSAFSGATLLAFLLGSHPEIATVGEMNGLIPQENPGAYLCSCGQQIKRCVFWDSVRVAMDRKGFEFDVAHFNTRFMLGGPPIVQYLRLGSFRNKTLDAIRDAIFRIWPEETRQLKALVARNTAFIEAVLEVTGKSVFVDTSKDRLRLKSLHKFSALDVRAIHLVRDVRGVVASRLRRDETIDASTAARQWVRLNQKLQVNLQTLPDNKRILLRYEDLCQDVDGTLERLFDFCGADPDVRVADFRTAEHHIVGNTMRLGHESEIRLNESWKTLLGAVQLEEISRMADAMCRRYGYR